MRRVRRSSVHPRYATRAVDRGFFSTPLVLDSEIIRTTHIYHRRDLFLPSGAPRGKKETWKGTGAPSGTCPIEVRGSSKRGQFPHACSLALGACRSQLCREQSWTSRIIYVQTRTRYRMGCAASVKLATANKLGPACSQSVYPCTDSYFTCAASPRSG